MQDIGGDGEQTQQQQQSNSNQPPHEPLQHLPEPRQPEVAIASYDGLGSDGIVGLAGVLFKSVALSLG